MGEKIISDNSLYHTNLSERTALILVPHEDDEINMAGNLIPLLEEMGVTVFVAFLTNGDYEISADIRIDEAVRALRLLGVSRDCILFLGYPDTLNYASCGHVYRNEGQPILAENGRCETYGGAGFTDYSHVRFGSHSKYTHECMFRDMRTLILDIAPDLIVGVDLDLHADHRALSLLLDEVLCDIFRSFPEGKRPILLKRFAYSTAYNAPPDYYSDNLRETIRPHQTAPGGAIIDSSYYVWGKRIRIPVLKENRGEGTASFEKTKIFQAMLCHNSQKLKLKAERIINSDEVFFLRRTDSISYHARVSATSGNPDYINDFRLNNMKDIDSYQESFGDYLWIPREDDEEKILTMEWEYEVVIEALCIWGNIEGNPIQKIELSFSDGNNYFVGPLLERGKGLNFFLPKRIRSSYCKVKLLDVPQGSGLAEIEVFSKKEHKKVFPPYIKMLFYDNFVYDYNRRITEKRIKLGVYGESGEVKWTILRGDAEIAGNELVLKDNSVVSVKLQLVKAPHVFDIVTITPRTNAWFIKLYCLHKVQKCRMTWAKICWSIEKRYVRYGRIKKERGIMSVISMITKQVKKKIGRVC
mgnify:FL=1